MDHGRKSGQLEQGDFASSEDASHYASAIQLIWICPAMPMRARRVAWTGTEQYTALDQPTASLSQVCMKLCNEIRAKVSQNRLLIQAAGRESSVQILDCWCHAVHTQVAA